MVVMVVVAFSEQHFAVCEVQRSVAVADSGTRSSRSGALGCDDGLNQKTGNDMVVVVVALVVVV